LKKRSYEELQQHSDHLERQNTLLAFYLFDTVRGVTPDVAIKNKQFEGKLYRALAPHEGYFVLNPLEGIEGVPGIHYLNDIDEKWPIEIRLLADKLKVARQRLWTADIVKTS